MEEEDEEEEKHKESSIESKIKVKDLNKEKINENQQENQDNKEIEEEGEDEEEEGEEDETEDLVESDETASLARIEKHSVIDSQEASADVKVYLEQVRKENKQKIKTSSNATRCPMCSYDAPSPRDLETHQRVHHLKRRFFQCAKCSYVTHVRARYTKHVKYHSMPMIKCDSCDFRTPYKWNLDRHTRNHGGGGAFQCRACNFTADIRQSLTVHETNHHEPPVGQINKKASTPFERKPRNSPKRYNQVGGSDFRELLGTVTSVSLGESYNSDQSLEDRKSMYAGAECIALKCEEKACQFVTAWDSEMQRHLAECHAPPTPSKSRKPLPMLIPLSPVSIKPSSMPSSGSAGNTLLKVPRVRVRPELAQIARDTEMAKLYGNKEVTLKRSISNATNAFERKNASFFDKLKEKLNTSSNGGVPEVAVSTISDLKCWCTYKASSMEELACHKQTHHTALSVSVTTTCCSKCRRRCKNATDLEVHMQFCQQNVDIPAGSSFQKLLNYTQVAAYHSEFSCSSHLQWDMGLGGHNSSGSSVEHQTWEDQSAEERNVKDGDFNEPPNKLLIMSNKESSENSVVLRPPPPLKAAVKSRGQSLLKNNVINSHSSGASASTTASNATTITLDKRNLWRYKQGACKEFKSQPDVVDQNANNESNLFGCGDCPFSAPDITSLSMHRLYHRPNKDAIFKCYLCPYYVNTKAELLEHARLHGEELAVVHQQSVDYRGSPISKCKIQLTNPDDDSEDAKEETGEIIPTTSKNSSTSGLDMSKSSVTPPPPLLLDTRALPDAPLVWVSRPDGTLTKMLKCRHCPYITSRRAEVRDHENMHTECVSDDAAIACTDCSFICTHREVMLSHAEMHSGSLGTVHCLVDQTRSDSQQLSDLATLLGLNHQPVLGQEPDLKDLRLVHCCSKCPARFLCEKELRIHMRYHSTELAYTCQWCSYAARQSSHLLAHQKAHSTEYQERTKYLLTLYGHSQRYPPPATACVESNSQEFGETTGNVAWIVVEMTEGSPPVATSDMSNITSTSTSSYDFNSSLCSSSNQRSNNQVFTCAKCPARYFKLDALEYHMTLHGSNNRFKCTECDYSSKTAQNLIKHQVVHRRQGKASNIPLSVPQNSDSIVTPPPPDPQFGVFMRGNPNFVYPGYLRNGRLKEKRYKCHKCPSAFEKREQYRVHLTLHGAKQRYRCNTCDYSVKYYANYIQHLKKHQANAEAQASRRRLEDDHISVDSDSLLECAQSNSRSGKTIRSNLSIGTTMTTNASCITSDSNSASISNQDKQTLILMQKKGMLPANYEPEIEIIRCQNCPFSTSDKDTMDSHKRRHGIERMTPSCPHCDYIPRRDENVGEHIRLHFTRLYKPESYLIVELLTLTMRKIAVNGKEERHKSSELLFKECGDGRFFPQTDGASNALNNFKEKVIVDPNTGETKQHVAAE